MGTSGAAGFTYVQLYDQYNVGGSKNINPLDAAGAGVGTVGLVANSMAFLGYGGSTAVAVGSASGYAGLFLSVPGLWYSVYSPIFNMQKYNTPITNNPNEAEYYRILNDNGVSTELEIFR